MVLFAKQVVSERRSVRISPVIYQFEPWLDGSEEVWVRSAQCAFHVDLSDGGMGERRSMRISQWTCQMDPLAEVHICGGVAIHRVAGTSQVRQTV